MEDVRGIVVCVHYDDLLAITLPRNIRFLSECLVVTSPDDVRTKELVASIPNCRLFETDLFYRNGAKFNKGAALEAGMDILGRDGWILIWDADTLFPENMVLHPKIKPGNLYGPPRLILDDPKQWSPEFEWKCAHGTVDWEFPGYFQLFQADDPVLKQRPWYGIDWVHAGGGDSVFQYRWPPSRKIRLPFHVLHLGPRDTNWYGRASERLDGEAIPEASERLESMRDLARFKHFYNCDQTRAVVPVQERIPNG